MQKNRSPDELMNLVKTLDVNIVQLRPGNWKEEDWKNLLNMRVKFTIFYADTNEDYEKFINKNPYGIFTNFPNKLSKFLELFLG